ncbi:Cas10/Cmr2 second palm domain-containing protein [Paraflavitalea speifideaquila]|uniref:Cas10/Cmr2 second palm domain-containing protein n=1 Tax=Paraflavitalea speifideaquila TaxID=3076558 RepID=UPI0028E19231|nr:hypothetical protein [Paraflavitalea speifideiaquila]
MEKQQYLLKLDISGIQSFIFDVKSKGAANELKGRSIYVYSITEIAHQLLLDKFPHNFSVVYKGGGNLVVKITANQEELERVTHTFQSYFLWDQLFPFIAFINTDGIDFKKQMQTLNQALKIKELQRTFSPDKKDIDNDAPENHWKDFTKELATSQGFEIVKCNENDSVKKSGLTKAGYIFKLTNSNNAFTNKLLNKIYLLENGSVVTFDQIAANCINERKVDNKLAALKIDVDNLSKIFRERNEAEYMIVSRKIDQFFSETIYQQLLKNGIDSGNIYPLFAGGDDCF